MTAALQVRGASMTDVGRARERNEDACFAGAHVFAVADGLGGHRAGEVASTVALEAIVVLDDLEPKRAAGKLTEAVRAANRSVTDRAAGDEGLKGMGTTMTAVVVQDSTAYLAHVGDSRCYLIRDASITQLSRDHTLVARMVDEGRITAEQAETHPQRSVLTRALGAEREIEVDEARFSLQPADRLLLCSDGLTAVLSDDDILALATHGEDLQETCRMLVDEANQRGGPDNITVVLVEAQGAPGVVPAAKRNVRARRGRPSWQRRHIPARAIVWSSIVLTLALGGFITVRTITNRSYYVGIKDGKVAIFRGVPLEVGSATLSKVEEPTVIPTSSVAPYLIPRLEEGMLADSLADARRIIAQQLVDAQGRPFGSVLDSSPTASPSGSTS